MKKATIIFCAVALALMLVWPDGQDTKDQSLVTEAPPASVDAIALAVPTTVPETTTTTKAVPPTAKKIVRQAPKAAPPKAKPAAPSGSAEAAIRKWFPDVYEKAVRIARCESGLNPAKGPSPTNDYGLFQINGIHKKNFTAVTGQPFLPGVYNADHNAHYARNLYNSSGWRPWSCRNA